MTTVKHQNFILMYGEIYIYMLFAGREVRIGKNCTRGLEYGPRPQAEGRAQDRGHSFPNTNRLRPENNAFIYFSGNYFIRNICLDFLLK